MKFTARDGDYFLHIGFRRPKNDTEQNTAEDGTILGVDLGLENLAVTSTASFFTAHPDGFEAEFMDKPHPP